MYNVSIKNCNSIANGEIRIEEGKLNIKYGINGTGKTTIAKALEYYNDNDKLQSLKSYFAEDPAQISITPTYNKVLVFNEDFVNQVVFKENEVIENSFEVFLKTPNYDQKKQAIDERLQNLHQIVEGNEEIKSFRDLLSKFDKSFARNSDGSLRMSGTLKSLVSKQNMYNIPEELSDYKPFIENADINIKWIDWKNKGDDFDIEDVCPYCTKELSREQHNQKKAVFKQTYKKADSNNLKEVVDLLEELKDYLIPTRYDLLMSYIRTDTDPETIASMVRRLVDEANLLLIKLDNIDGFGKHKIAAADISALEHQLEGMKIPYETFDSFGGDKTEGVVYAVNERVEALIAEVADLKREMGDLKGLLLATIRDSQKDINEFLSTAGIKYEIVIIAEDETESKTILRQCYTEDKTDVYNIKQHLSWGEKNAFSLVLFMYYANHQNPDLIILDDPISSFDSNKKYAILHRLFKNVRGSEVSMLDKTVLLLTHDPEPITDFLVVGKLDENRAKASFIWNEDGELQEKDIDVQNDIKMIVGQCESIAKDEDVNVISRITFLRKLSELHMKQNEWEYTYEILSCLVHAKEIKRKIGHDTYVDMLEEEIDKGMERIEEYIPDFDYQNLKDSVFTLAGIKNLYQNEGNSYYKLQIFRALKDIGSEANLTISETNEAWYKYIDETYHIENDNLYCLDVDKFNIVPSYIAKKVDDIMTLVGQETV